MLDGATTATAQRRSQSLRLPASDGPPLRPDTNRLSCLRPAMAACRGTTTPPARWSVGASTQRSCNPLMWARSKHRCESFDDYQSFDTGPCDDQTNDSRFRCCVGPRERYRVRSRRREVARCAESDAGHARDAGNPSNSSASWCRACATSHRGDARRAPEGAGRKARKGAGDEDARQARADQDAEARGRAEGRSERTGEIAELS